MSLFVRGGALRACVAAVAVLVAAPALAQDNRGDCEDYAREAVKQAERNERQNCGYDGPRWSDNRQSHFAWCLISPRQARQENEARTDLLEKCADRRADRKEERRDERREERREERVGKRANCETYSKIAEVQAEANDKYNCGMRGGEWSKDERDHFRWCMRNRRDYMLDEIRYRAAELQKCFNTLGDYDDTKEEDKGYRRRRF